MGQELSDLGATASILTTRPNRTWPRKVFLDPLMIYRVEGSFWNPLRASRYCKSLTQWIANNAHSLSQVYFDDAGMEASYFLNHARHLAIPTVIRFDVSQWTNRPGSWQPPKILLDGLRRADLIHVPNNASQRCLAAAGIVDTPVQRVSEYYLTDLDRSIGARRNARRNLGNISSDLMLHSGERLMICIGECSEKSGVVGLVEKLVPILEKNLRLKLWVLGEGEARGKIYQTVKHHGLNRAVFVPGVFTELSSLFQAADLCVFPGPAEGLSALIPTCLHNDVPFLATQSDYLSEWLQDDYPNLVPHAKDAWASALELWERDPNQILTATMKLKQAIAQQPRLDSPATTLRVTKMA